jgi:hypothetical protein
MAVNYHIWDYLVRNIFAGGHNFHGNTNTLLLKRKKAVNVVKIAELTAMPNFGLEKANQKRKIIEHLKKHTWDTK